MNHERAQDITLHKPNASNRAIRQQRKVPNVFIDLKFFQK